MVKSFNETGDAAKAARKFQPLWHKKQYTNPWSDPKYETKTILFNMRKRLNKLKTMQNINPLQLSRQKLIGLVKQLEGMKVASMQEICCAKGVFSDLAGDKKEWEESKCPDMAATIEAVVDKFQNNFRRYIKEK